MRSKLNPFTAEAIDLNRESLRGLTDLRTSALDSLRETVKQCGYEEVAPLNLLTQEQGDKVPSAVPFAGSESNLGHNTQIGLDMLVLKNGRGVFMVNHNFQDALAAEGSFTGGSERTLIEAEKSFQGRDPESALENLIAEIEHTVKGSMKRTLSRGHAEIYALDGDLFYLSKVTNSPFARISYTEALELLNSNGYERYRFGDVLGAPEEQKIVAAMKNLPTFITHFPSDMASFNTKRSPDDKISYSVDLVVPHVGQLVGGGLREESAHKIEKQLKRAKKGQAHHREEASAAKQLERYLKAFGNRSPMLRGGYGIGFNRFIGFVLHQTR